MAFTYDRYGVDTVDFRDGDRELLCPSCFAGGGLSLDLCTFCRMWVCLDCLDTGYDDVCLNCIKDD